MHERDTLVVGYYTFVTNFKYVENEMKSAAQLRERGGLYFVKEGSMALYNDISGVIRIPYIELFIDFAYH